MKFGRIVVKLHMHRLTGWNWILLSHFQDGGYDVMSHRKVMPSGECTQRSPGAPCC